MFSQESYITEASDWIFRLQRLYQYDTKRDPKECDHSPDITVRLKPNYWHDLLDLLSLSSRYLLKKKVGVSSPQRLCRVCVFFSPFKPTKYWTQSQPQCRNSSFPAISNNTEDAKIFGEGVTQQPLTLQLKPLKVTNITQENLKTLQNIIVLVRLFMIQFLWI